MFADAVLMTSATGGTGALTLSAVTGSPGFDKPFGASGTRFVAYGIVEYTDAGRTQVAKEEAGIGSLALSTLVLTRTKVLAAWNGTTYDATNPAAVSLGTTAANIQIRCAPSAAHDALCMPWHNRAVGDAIGFCGANSFGLSSTHAYVAGTEYYEPYLWTGTGDVDQVSVIVTTAVAGSAGIKAGIYEFSTTGVPGRRLVDITAGSTLAAATTGTKSVTVNFWLPRGWCYVGSLVDQAVSLRSAQSPIACPIGSSTGTVVRCLSVAGSYATGLPATSSGTMTANTTSCPAFYLRQRN